MVGTAVGYTMWDGGNISVTAEDIATIPWTAGELDELELLFDSGSSSTSASPPLVSFTTPPTTTMPMPMPFFTASALGGSMEAPSTVTSSTGTSPAMTTSMPMFSIPANASTVKSASNRTSPSNASTPPDTHSLKRKQDRERNTEAARRYRKRRVDETDDLRARLDAMTKERDSLRLQLVKAETEADLLRKLVGQSKIKS